MSTHALRTSEQGAPSGRSLLAYADLVVLALALPVFAAAGWPLGGYAVCAGAWVLQRGIHVLIMRRASASDNPRAVVGLLGASLMARIWFMALAILLVGLSNEEAGLAAAVLAVVLFQVYLTTMMIERSRVPGRQA